jgi:hypothetical protein
MDIHRYLSGLFYIDNKIAERATLAVATFNVATTRVPYSIMIRMFLSKMKFLV